MAKNKYARDAENPQWRKEIGIRIKQIREERGMSQEELADRLGKVSRQTITMWETAYRDIKTTDIVRLADALGVSCDFLLGETDKNKKPSFVANQLSMLIELNNTTIKAVADHLGISRQAVSQYCNGDTQPNADTIVKMAEFFNVSCDYLLRGITKKDDTDTIKSMIERIADEKIKAAETAIAELKQAILSL